MFDGQDAQRVRVRRYRSSGIIAQVATEPWQLDAYYSLRRRVFVQEQSLFEGNDRDAIDEQALPIVAISCCGGMPDQVVGVVRIHPTQDAALIGNVPEGAGQVWQGGRLAVARSYRRHGVVGEALIRAAVCTAHHHACSRFLATVQRPVVCYFERHRFRWLQEVSVCGQAHALMEAELTAYPAHDFARPFSGTSGGLLWADCAQRRLRAQNRSATQEEVAA